MDRPWKDGIPLEILLHLQSEIHPKDQGLGSTYN